MNRIEGVARNPTEHRFNTNSNIWTAAHGYCIVNEPLQATKLKKGKFTSLNKITAFSYTLRGKVHIPKGTTFCKV